MTLPINTIVNSIVVLHLLRHKKPRWEGSDAERFLKAISLAIIMWIKRHNNCMLHAVSIKCLNSKFFVDTYIKKLNDAKFCQVFMDANLTRNKLSTKQNSKTCQDTTNCYCILYFSFLLTCRHHLCV